MKYQHVYNEYEIIISSTRFISKPFYADNLVWNIFCKDFNDFKTRSREFHKHKTMQLSG